MTIARIGAVRWAFFSCIAAYFLAGIVLIAWPKADPTPLISRDQWKVEGQIFPIDAGSNMDFPRAVRESPARVLWRSWSPESLGTTGTVSSAPFQPARFLAVPFFGFPGEAPGVTVSLRCILSARDLPISN